jgi:diguanylate cyclase
MTTRPLDLDQLPALHRCARDGSLELRYQPEVDLQTGAIPAMEGLLRWHHPDLGLLPPPVFLSLAEASGEIVPMGEWVLRTGAAEVASWADLPGEPRRLWLNVSATELGSPGYADLVARVVAQAGLAPGVLGLEATEADVLALGDRAAPLMEELRAAGVALAVDDLTGFYSTLGAIEALPLDAVKVAPRHVRGLGEPGGPDRFTQSIVEQAHARGLLVVAEGVETWGEAARLTELGCDRAHGWLFSSDQRADKARWLLVSGRGWPDSPTVPLPRAAVR